MARRKRPYPNTIGVHPRGSVRDPAADIVLGNVSPRNRVQSQARRLLPVVERHGESINTLVRTLEKPSRTKRRKMARYASGIITGKRSSK